MAKVKSFSIPDNEIGDFEKLLFQIGKVDRWSDSHIILTAVKEYAERHLPGNPQLVLPNYIPEMKTPFSRSAMEKLEWGQVCEECSGSGKNQFNGKCLNCAGLGRVNLDV